VDQPLTTRKHESTNWRWSDSAQDHSSDGQGRSVEVEKKAEAKARWSEIGLELCEVNVTKSVDRFQLDNNLIRDYEIHTGASYDHTLETDVKGELRLER
jgi:hypothetical protein